MNILKVLTKKRIVGNFGERAAARFLKKKGYQILEKSYVAKGHEIDLVAKDGDTVVFVEVKSRTLGHENPREPRPASSVTPEKQRGIITASRHFMLSKRLEKRMRYDVIEVYLEDYKDKKRVKEIKHLVNTFDLNTAYSRKHSKDY